MNNKDESHALFNTDDNNSELNIIYVSHAPIRKRKEHQLFPCFKRPACYEMSNSICREIKIG